MNHFRNRNITVENVNEWLDEKIFQKVIKNHLNLKTDEYKFISIDSKPFMKAGENFMAIVLRSKVEILKNDETISLSYIVKCLLSNVFKEEMVTGYSAFPKEKEIYSNILPAFEKLYKDHGLTVKFGPECYFETEEPAQIIIMEDLADYRMVPKNIGLNREHVEAGLVWLGKFHAASMAYHDEFGSYKELFQDGVYALRMEQIYQPYYNGYFPWFIEAVKKLPNGDKIVEKIQKWDGVLFRSIAKTLEYDPNGLNVLCHGDMWSNNLMFLYDEKEEINDLKVVDYQLLFWGSIAQDIFNFMMTSWQIDIKVKKFNDFIKIYHKSLFEHLKILNYKKNLPTLDDVHNELLRRKFLAAAFTIEILPFPLCEKEFTAEMGDEIFNVLYTNPKCQEAFAQVFPWLEELNAFDSPTL